MKLQKLLDMIELVEKHQLMDVVDIKEELIEVKTRYEEHDERDTWEDTVHIITLPGVVDLMNRTLYDYYGRMRRRIEPNEITDRFFIAELRCETTSENFGFEQFTSEMLQAGYEVIHDLWGENEAIGDNNPDGSFKHTTIAHCSHCGTLKVMGYLCPECGRMD